MHTLATHVKLQARACSRDHAAVPAGAWPGYHDLRVQSGIVTRDDRRIDVAFFFAARLAVIPLWRAIPLVGYLPFWKGFSLWTNQSERVYFYWPPGPNPVVTNKGWARFEAIVRAASLRAHGSARCHNNTHAYFVSGWEKEAERDDHFRAAPTENSGPKFKFRLLRSLVKLITFQNLKPKRVNKSEMLQNFSQTQGTVFHSSACISSSEGLFKNRSAHFCGKITVFWRLSNTNSNTLFPGAEISHEVKTDLHLWRPEFLRLPVGFRKPFQLTETRGFADHFLKISRSYSSGNLNYSNFPRAEQSGQLWCLAPYKHNPETFKPFSPTVNAQICASIHIFTNPSLFRKDKIPCFCASNKLTHRTRVRYCINVQPLFSQIEVTSEICESNGCGGGGGGGEVERLQ